MALADPTNYGNQPGDGPLRIGGVSLPDVPQQDKDLPSTPSAAAKRQAPAVAMVRDLWQGTDAVRAKGTAYLPQGAGEHPQDYAAKLKRAVFFNAFRRTVEGLTGLVFSKDPKLGDDVPAPIVDQWENIDNAGTHGDVFVRERLQDALQAGHNLILVEYPDTGGATTRADEAPLGPIRPYWVPVNKENVLSWRTTVEAGKTILTQLVLKECANVAAGMFGEVEQTRYRVLYRRAGVVGWALLEVTERKSINIVAEGLYPTQDEIPVVEIITSGRRGLFDSDPPLMDLAYLNIAHYQQLADANWARYKTNSPILFGAGITQPVAEDGSQPEEISVGPNSAILQANENASLTYVSHDGAALDNCDKALETLKSDMGTLGLAMLAPQKRATETAEAKRLDKATSDSALSVTARGLQDGVERALYFHARYLKLPDGGSIEINRDFEGLAMDPAVMSAFASLIAQGLPWEVALDQLQKGGRIGDDVDTTTVALEIATNRAADAQMKAEQLQSLAVPAQVAA